MKPIDPRPKRRPRKPTRPARKQETKRHWAMDETLQDILKVVGDADPKTVRITGDYGEGYVIRWPEPETAVSYAERLAKYEEKLQRYETWEKEHGEAYDIWAKEEKTKQLQKDLKKLETERKRLLNKLNT